MMLADGTLMGTNKLVSQILDAGHLGYTNLMADAGSEHLSDLLEMAHTAGKAIAERTLNGRVLIGADARESGETILSILESSLRAEGCGVVSMGTQNTTPSIEFLADHYGMDCGMSITGSHLPAGQNRIKVRFYAPHEGRDITDPLTDYLTEATADLPTSLGGTRIAIDCLHGTSARTMLPLLSHMGISIERDVHLLHGRPDACFPLLVSNAPDPTLYDNLAELCNQVEFSSLDFGFAIDGDGDRFIIVDDEGKIIDPVIAGLLFGSRIFSPEKYAYVTESKVQFAHATMLSYGMEPVFMPTGRPNIIKELVRLGARGAFEISGHIYDSRGYDDAAKNIAHLIAYCKTQGAVLSEVAADIQKRLPSYSPEIRCSCPDKERILAIVKDIGAGTLGGYLLSEGCSATDAHHSGMFVRASKNEDMLTIMLWGPTREDMEQYKDNSLQLIGDREFTQAFNKEYHHRQQLRERYFRV